MAGKMGGPKAVDKATDFKGTLKKFLKIISEYKILIIIAFLFAIGSTIFAIISPKDIRKWLQQKYIWYYCQINGTGTINFNAIKSILICLAILYIISALFNYIQNLIMTHVAQRASYKLRKRISHKLK